MMVFLVLAILLWLNIEHKLTPPWYVWVLWVPCFIAKVYAIGDFFGKARAKGGS